MLSITKPSQGRPAPSQSLPVLGSAATPPSSTISRRERREQQRHQTERLRGEELRASLTSKRAKRQAKRKALQERNGVAYSLEAGSSRCGGAGDSEDGDGGERDPSEEDVATDSDFSDRTVRASTVAPAGGGNSKQEETNRDGVAELIIERAAPNIDGQEPSNVPAVWAGTTRAASGKIETTEGLSPLPVTTSFDTSSQVCLESSSCPRSDPALSPVVESCSTGTPSSTRTHSRAKPSTGPLADRNFPLGIPSRPKTNTERVCVPFKSSLTSSSMGVDADSPSELVEDVEKMSGLEPTPLGPHSSAPSLRPAASTLLKAFKGTLRSTLGRFRAATAAPQAVALTFTDDTVISEGNEATQKGNGSAATGTSLATPGPSFTNGPFNTATTSFPPIVTQDVCPRPSNSRLLFSTTQPSESLALNQALFGSGGPKIQPVGQDKTHMVKKVLDAVPNRRVTHPIRPAKPVSVIRAPPFDVWNVTSASSKSPFKATSQLASTTQPSSVSHTTQNAQPAPAASTPPQPAPPPPSNSQLNTAPDQTSATLAVTFDTTLFDHRLTPDEIDMFWPAALPKPLPRRFFIDAAKLCPSQPPIAPQSAAWHLGAHRCAVLILSSVSVPKSQCRKCVRIGETCRRCLRKNVLATNERLARFSSPALWPSMNWTSSLPIVPQPEMEAEDDGQMMNVGPSSNLPDSSNAGANDSSPASQPTANPVTVTDTANPTEPASASATPTSQCDCVDSASDTQASAWDEDNPSSDQFLKEILQTLD